MKKILTTLLAGLIFNSSASAQQKVYTQDIDNFWIAYDSARLTSDSLKQIQILQALYVDKGTKGLKAFMEARDYSAPLWVALIRKYPKFWNSIRPNTLTVKNKATAIEQSIARFKELYPQLKDAKMYFTVGGLNSGGTTSGDMVLVGSEIATGTATTDVSEFPNKWLAGVFKEQSPENIIPLNIHEYVHTQQKGEGTTLLSAAIREGACDFITELVIGKPMRTNYINYGLAHEEELKELFKREMFTKCYANWLYNGTRAKTVADLGYFMGYSICKSYYQKATNKKKAIKEIIELNYSNESAVESFLNKSGYYNEVLDKAKLIKDFEAKQPVVVRTEPFANGDTLVDPGTREVKIIFSVPMDTGGYSINFGEKGKEHYPIAGVVGFSEDKTAFIVKTELVLNKVYEFVITNGSFNSAAGYPLLKNYTVKFKTRK